MFNASTIDLITDAIATTSLPLNELCPDFAAFVQYAKDWVESANEFADEPYELPSESEMAQVYREGLAAIARFC